ncbi:MAG: NCS2 family permease [Gemmatimonadetes bacterium]|nr:NCS2 family permease [Gemmatimonadota bacterium]
MREPGGRGFFQLEAHGTTASRETMAGLATCLTMAYIVVVNPSVLADAGVPFEGARFATCVGAAAATLIMGLVANYPFALAPGMGLNAYFAYSVVGALHVPWQTALGAVFLSGVIFMLLTAGRIRALIVDAIPAPVKHATAAGIGLFIAFIGLRNGGLVVADQATFVRLGEIGTTGPLLVLGGLLLSGALMARGRRSAILVGIAAVTAAAMLLGLDPLPKDGFALPDPGGTLFRLDVRGALGLGLLDIVFVFLFVDMFDTVGSLIGLAQQGGFLAPDGSLPRVNRALAADAGGTMIGALFGTSTVTTYIESAAGIGAGGRTGLTAVTVAVLFLLASFFAPLAAAVPSIATAPALILVGVLMTQAITLVKWQDTTEALPAFVTAIAMPLTFSIANGIALGFLTYAGIKLLAGRAREVGWLVWILAALFLVRFAYLGSA